MSYAVERMLLATVVSTGATPDVVDALESMSPKMFADNSHSDIYIELLNMARKAIPISLGTLLERNSENYEYVSGIYELASSPKSIVRFADILKTTHNSRLAVKMLEKAISSLNSAPESLADSLGALEANISTIDVTGEDGDPIAMADYIPGYMDLMERRNEGCESAKGIDIGLDMPINRTDLIVVGGLPGMGKTALAMFCADHVAKPATPVLMFSLEMEGMQVFEREVSRHGNIQSYALKDPVKYDLNYGVLGKALTALESKSIYIDDSPRLDIFSFKSKARRFKSKHPTTALIIVDYLTLMDLPSAERRDLSIGEVTRQMKLLAKEIKTPIFLLSQMNRSAAKEKREPEVSDLRDSGSIEQDADKIIFPYREEVLFPDSVNKGLCKVLKRKVRDGETGATLLTFRNGNMYQCDNRAWVSEEGGNDDFKPDF